MTTNQENHDLLNTPSGKAAQHVQNVIERMTLEYVFGVSMQSKHQISLKHQHELDAELRRFRHNMHETVLQILHS